jgi:hypothetical protein
VRRPARARATSTDFHRPDLAAATDLASSRRALDTSLELQRRWIPDGTRAI